MAVVEILPKEEDEPSQVPAFVEALTVTVEPKECRTILEQLNGCHPLAEYKLSHLKRVKREQAGRSGDEVEASLAATDNDDLKQASTTKRKRSQAASLAILIGPVSADISLLDNWKGRETSCCMVPARPPESEAEWKDFNAVWPTQYKLQKSREVLEQSRRLSSEEIEQARVGMAAALQDANSVDNTNGNDSVGVVVMSPNLGTIVATASRERQLQGEIIQQNPLATPVILAIQGVSRLERQAAVDAGTMQSDAFRTCQYLCTGYDVYATVEPTVFEAMALLHSRIRRVVFCKARPKDGGITKHRVHCLKHTNHRYRAFHYQQAANDPSKEERKS